MNIVKIDVDGVIRNMFDNMCDIYNKEFNENLTVNDIWDYDVEKVFPRIKEELNISAAEYFFQVHAKELFLDSEPYDGVKESIEKLRDNGYKIVIATWQYTLENKLYTLEFLDRYEIPYDDICFTKDKWMICADWMIDDNPEFILDDKDLSSHKILIQMPYNKNTKYGNYCVSENLLNAVNHILDVDSVNNQILDLKLKRNNLLRTKIIK